ncbi:MAG: class I SAM-dependent rRNA methyltransferase [Bacteroidota bacterium]|nr:class I SAM-dependent rRNA methyltransferase [Candidatus Kapabacteria bacterium]MDW8219192.1 class I SAM-dependent rRNA methyltransferase [Bacteroidota bacterium]
MTTLIVKNRHNARLRSGHLWVFRDDLESIPSSLAPGELVAVQSAGGHQYGTALFHPTSLIAARLLLSTTSELSAEFFVERIRQALALRERVLPSERTFRLVFGESDFLPGLIIDRYHDITRHQNNEYFVLQTLSAGMDNKKDEICTALRIVFPATHGILEKNTSALRQHDGLDKREGILWGTIPPAITIAEHGILSSVSLLEGQKTGYFLDQKLNRLKVKGLAAGLRVLDCFTNQGGFALHAACGGAHYVLGLDSSQTAIQRCHINAELNGLSDIATFRCEDVTGYLQNAVEHYRNEPERPWDMIILDPPAFAKSKHHIPQAKRGYARINRMALRLLPRGGLLATGSCSHHISEDMLFNIILQEAERERRQLRLLFHGRQSPCHPILASMPETSYLKFFIFEVI